MLIYDYYPYRFNKEYSKNISRKKEIKCLETGLQICKALIWWSSHFETLYLLINPRIVILILTESFFEPSTIHGTQFFFRKFNFVIKVGRIQLSVQTLTVTEFTFVFQTNESLMYQSQSVPLNFKQINFRCNSHRTWLYFKTKLSKILKINLLYKFSLSL